MQTATATSLDPAALRGIIATISAAVIAHADELTTLDQAIGDGDHGLNMKRGFEAVSADILRISANSPAEAFKALGTMLVMKVGGASGPLYGTLFMAFGKALPPLPNRQDVATAMRAAVEAVKARGKSEAGQKTMLDVLIPALEAFTAGADPVAAAHAAAEATVPMKAIRGRASFLGERSIGHMDPGARSSALIIEAASKAWSEHERG
jgi:dihydroxyacetone kinase-like protein